MTSQLETLKPGDVFTETSHGRTLTYKVDCIRHISGAVWNVEATRYHPTKNYTFGKAKNFPFTKRSNPHA